MLPPFEDTWVPHFSRDMHEPDFQGWGDVIRDYCANARHKEAVSFFLQKVRSSSVFKPNYQVLSSVLKSSAALSALHLGRTLHGHSLKLGHLACLCISKALLNLYAKSRALDDCRKMFGQIRSPDIVLWNIVLSGFAGSKGLEAETMRMFSKLHLVQDPKMSSVTVCIVLPLCARLGDLDAGKRAHSFVIKSGLDSHTLVGNALISMYAKCGRVMTDAYAAFTCIPDKDVVSWNAVIAGFAENKLMNDAFRMFRWMLKGSVAPNYATIANVLPVCGSLEKSTAYYIGRQIHSFVLQRTELAAEVSVCNALMTFYLRIGLVQEAETLFRHMKVRDLVSWNSVIAGYASNDEWSRALQLFHELVLTERFTLDSVTLASVLPVCAQLRQIQWGKQIHGYVLRRPHLFGDTTVMNNLVHFYAKCDEVEAAFVSFLMISSRDVVSWNTMLDAFSERGFHSQFLDLLSWMLKEGTKPDSVTMLILVNFSISVLRLQFVKELHGYIVRSGVLLGEKVSTIGNAMLDAYGKCGDVDGASKIFNSLFNKQNLVSYNSMVSGYVNHGSHDDAYKIIDRMLETDLIAWNSMIRVYAENECFDEALALFYQLQARGTKPNELTVMSLLPVCAQIASIHLLRQCHGYTVRTCFEDVILNASLLDVYAKCGSIAYAYNLFQLSPHKDLVMFTAMVGGFAMHGMGEEALKIFHHMISLGVKPDHVVITCVLSACSHAGLVNEGLEIFDSIQNVHRMTPTMEQYACLVDLLARGGRVNDAYSFVTQMPVKANANVWATLLGACRTHHEVELGRAVADHLFKIEANDVGNYIVLSNIYAANARWDGVLEMRKLMKTRDLRKPAGCSWIEVDRRKNVFIAGDYSHPERSIIFGILSTMDQQIKERLAGSSVDMLLNPT